MLRAHVEAGPSVDGRCTKGLGLRPAGIDPARQLPAQSGKLIGSDGVFDRGIAVAPELLDLLLAQACRGFLSGGHGAFPGACSRTISVRSPCAALPRPKE